jgi:hypothetical protein
MIAKRRILAMAGILSAMVTLIGCTAAAPPAAVPAPPQVHALGGGAGGAAPPAPPPTGTIPSYLPETPNLTEDITCRPTLAGQSNSDKDPTWGTASVGTINSACMPLSPWTRLLLENANFSANDTYTNQVGLGNTLIANPATTAQIQSSNIWGVGVGYTTKPILKQMRALFYPTDEREATSQQGTFWEDAFWEAIAVNASLSYGQALAKTNGVLTDALTTKPFYSVSASYSLNLERMWVYATHGGSPMTRPVDPGYYMESNFTDPGETPVVPWNQPVSNSKQ